MPSASQAWTEAHVRAADVVLALGTGDRLEVAIDLALEVRGGWLERLELPGLDDGLVLAEHEPAVAVLESGERVPAQVSLRASTMVLKFARRDGLRRGLHHLVLHYIVERPTFTPLSSPSGARLYWTLPGFEAGLASAKIVVRGARALAAVEAPEVAQDVKQQREAGQQVLTFSRLHVPRASPWTIAIDVPGMLAGAGRPLAHAQREEAREGAPLLTTALLALASLGLVWLMRLQTTRALRAEGLKARGLFTRRALSPLALVCLSVLSALSFRFVPALAVVGWVLSFALGVPQAESVRGPLALGGFRPLTRAELRSLARTRVREWLGVPWADASSLLGATGALFLLVGVGLWQGVAVVGQSPWGLLALCAMFGFLASARSLRGRSLAEQVALLQRAARRARTVGCAFSLVAYASKGRLGQPRLRIVPGVRYPGLLRLEVLVDTRRSARALVLSALVEAESPAERCLAELFPSAVRESGEGGRRIALLTPVDDVGKAAEGVLEQLSRESQRLFFAAVGNARAA